MGDWLNKEIPILLSMAHDRSESGRIALVEKISEVFLLNIADLSKKEEKLVQEFIEEIIEHESPAVRHALVSKFANAINATREVALRVGKSPIEIAGKTLAANENLYDDDLITIINKKSDDHAAAIATRKKISEAVCDALVTTGSVRVIQIVAENMGAKLSTKAIDVLINTARIASIIQKPLLMRPELNSQKAIELFWWVSKDLRKEALKKYGFGPGRLEEALGISIEKKLKTHLFEKDSDEAMMQISNWLNERDAISIRLLPQILRLNHYRLFNILLSRMSGLSLPLIDIIVKSKDVRLIVALSKSLEIDKGMFVSIFLMSRAIRNDEQIVNPSELRVSLETFDRLSIKNGKSMIYSWIENPDDLLNRSDVDVSL